MVLCMSERLQVEGYKLESYKVSNLQQYFYTFEL